MLITKRAVKTFLARPRNDYRFYKRLSEDQLQKRCDLLPVSPPHWSTLKLHQKACFILGVKKRRFAFYLDMGMGKTFLSVALARYFLKAKVATRFLVLVPNRTNKWEWKRDVEKNSPKTSIIVLDGSSKQKWDQLLNSDTTLVIETYAGLERMVSKLVPRKKKNRNKLQPDEARVRQLNGQISGLFMDESHLAQNKHALAYRICKRIAKHAQVVFALSGTPFGRDPSALWGQINILDDGYTLGETLGLFRSTFFTVKRTGWAEEFTFDPKKDKLMRTVLANVAINYEADEGDLPKVSSVPKYCDLPEDAQSYFNRARESIVAANGAYREMRNAFLRMRQISSGFLGYHDDETGEKAKFVFPENPKLELLEAVLEEIGDGHKAVVFHDFLFSGDRLSKRLTELDIPYALLNGKTKDPDAVLERFKKDARVLLLNNSAGAYGLDRIKVARYGIYYESPVSVTIRKQTERRIRRQFSEHSHVFLIDLICNRTVDAKILEYHAQGKSLFEAIIKGGVDLTTD